MTLGNMRENGLRSTKWIIVVLALASLSGCIGENKHEAIAKCWMEFAKAPKDQLPSYPLAKSPQEFFTAQCMQAHGFEFLPKGCSSANEYYTSVADCYEPFTFENKLRKWIVRD